MKLENSNYLPVIPQAEEYFIRKNGKLNAIYCKMKDGNYVKSYYQKLGGKLEQEIITKELYEEMQLLEI